MSRPLRPALRYHGGKWVLAPWIIQHFGEHRVYVEPYGGAASVLLRKPKSYAEVYNDLDDDVVNMFRVLQDPTSSARLVELVRLTPFARAEFELSYEATDDPIERARRLIIRSFMGFGSNGHARKTGFRSNSNRSGTTPAADWMNYPDNLALVADRFRRCVIENRPALQVMATHDVEDALHFLDPPYLPETRNPGRDYNFELTVEQHAELLDFIPSLKGAVVLAGYPSEMYDKALVGWQRVQRAARSDGAGKRTEVLWLNPAASASIAQKDIFVDGGRK